MPVSGIAISHRPSLVVHGRGVPCEHCGMRPWNGKLQDDRWGVLSCAWSSEHCCDNSAATDESRGRRIGM